MPERTLERITEVAALVRAEAAASESAGRLTAPVVVAMREAGVFRMAMSRSTPTKTYANCGRSLLGLDPGGIVF